MNIDELFECELFEDEVVNDEWVAPHCTIVSVKQPDLIPAELDIPLRICDEYYVTEIAEGAFAGISNLRSVTAAGRIESIGANAFKDCVSLATVKLGGMVEYIGSDAFKGCNAVTEVYFRDLQSLRKISFENEFSNPAARAESIYLDDKPMGKCVELSCEKYLRDVTLYNYVFSGSKIETLKFAENALSVDVAAHALDGCETLTEVILPDNLRTLRPRGLRSCKSIKYNRYDGLNYLGSESNPYLALIGVDKALPSHTIHPDTKIIALGAFADDTVLTEITVTEGVKVIASDAFKNCVNLRRVNLPSTVTSIGCAFEGCKAIEEVHVPSLTAWCKITFSGDMQGSTANPVEGADLYVDGKLVEDVVIPKGVCEVPHYAFYGCKSLKSVVIPDDVTSIGHYAFYNCSALKSVAIPNSVTSLGGYVFKGCCNLKTVTLPPVYSLQWGLFGQCTSLESVLINAATRDLGWATFDGCRSLTKVEIPHRVERIEVSVFEGCTSLTEVSIPPTVSFINGSAFKGCSSLESVTLPPSVRWMSDNVFEDCISLKRIEIAPSFASAGKNVFKGCSDTLEIVAIDSVKQKFK